MKFKSGITTWLTILWAAVIINSVSTVKSRTESLVEEKITNVSLNNKEELIIWEDIPFDFEKDKEEITELIFHWYQLRVINDWFWIKIAEINGVNKYIFTYFDINDIQHELEERFDNPEDLKKFAIYFQNQKIK
ncbi:MAG: hypothetical protein ACD_4C00004G0002 [uncultured bacterium (gcode 4)]|uniref:Uncharacterized protein n=1 Tax=uncultured bacterium (gcode 4) TaxID=1234023 RepID=K2GAP3_9BACT|nr:MAG: hypothetical protein ACD_4C00004G0002 [uncultured bacterium (gcode 4)]